MVNLTMNEDMLEILASMKGKTLKSIEGEYRLPYKNFREFVRFNLGRFAVEVYSNEVGVQWFWNSNHIVQDEATRFMVFKKDLAEHEYQKGWKAIQLMKDEKISEVVVVRDQIKNSKGDEILVDSGFVLRTDENVYTFSKCDLSSYAIHMNESSKIDMYYSVKRAKEDCSDKELGLAARVNREYTFL